MPRYIDADEVLETMRSNMDMQELYLPTHFIDLVIEDMPTADVQPVKHGRWKLRCYGDYPYCSSCNNEPKSREMTLYCPNCGARMDGDSE
jgi:NADH pyrophosphatase NudC (nudix superfamily)